MFLYPYKYSHIYGILVIPIEKGSCHTWIGNERTQTRNPAQVAYRLMRIRNSTDYVGIRVRISVKFRIGFL
jgi:hypothetical protein